jgi:hypothetical protein
MLARGKFRDQAAVLGMQPDLRRDDGGKHASIVNDGGAGFIAGSLEREEQGSGWLNG